MTESSTTSSASSMTPSGGPIRLNYVPSSEEIDCMQRELALQFPDLTVSVALAGRVLTVDAR
jgi:hypothetical protein